MQAQSNATSHPTGLTVCIDGAHKLLPNVFDEIQSKSLGIKAIGDVNAVFQAENTTITLDPSGDFYLRAVVSPTYTLSAEEFQASNLDSWLDLFKSKLSEAKLGQVRFSPNDFIVEFDECIVKLPHKNSPNFEFKFPQIDNSDVEAVRNVAMKALTVFGIYLRTIAKAVHAQELSGEIKIDSGGFDFNAVAENVGKNVKGLVDDLSKSKFGEGVKGLFGNLRNQAKRRLLNTEGLRYRAKEKRNFEGLFGQDENVERLQEVVQILKSNEFTPEQKRAAMPKLVVLTGPTGVGKSHSMEALIQAVPESPAYILTSASLMSSWYGNTERMTEQLMSDVAEAADNSPNGIAFLVIDEGDTALPARGLHTHETTARTLSLVLQNISGIAAPEGVILIIATNLPGKLDTALISRVDLELEYGELSTKSLVSGLMYQMKQFVEEHKGFKLEDFSTTSLTAMLKDKDGRVIPRIKRELLQLRMLNKEPRDEEGDLVIDLELLKLAIRRAK